MSHNEDGVEAQPQPTLCSNGCGFFSNAGSSGMCSKCYRQTEREQQTLDAVTHKTAAALADTAAAAAQSAAAAELKKEPAEKTQVAATAAAMPGASISPTASLTSSAEAPPPSSGPCRCRNAGCKKKLGLTGFTCRCGLIFCGQHRLAESHACTFDYKTFERLKIQTDNPLVQAAKVQKL